MMITKDYLDYVVREIHTTIVATVDDEGLPATAAIDMMDTDGDSLYFLTAKGKGFYDRLIKRKFLAFTAIRGENTMSSAAVSVRGKVRELGYDRIPELFRKNPYMHEIYPTEEAMRALTAFQLYEGSGEWFDLSKKPIERASFTFGGAGKKQDGYIITDTCTGCGICVTVCPQNCILNADKQSPVSSAWSDKRGAKGDACVSGSLKLPLTRRAAACVHEHVAERNANVRFTDGIPYRIQQEHCLHCGSCLMACPAGAVERR